MKKSMLVVNSLVPVHLALPMIRNFSWGQHFLQRWMDLFSIFKMFTSTSRSPAPAVLLVEGQELPTLMPGGESRGIARWNSNPKKTQRQATAPFPSPQNPSLRSLGWSIHEKLAVHPTYPPWGLRAPLSPQGGLHRSTKAQAACRDTKHQGITNAGDYLQLCPHSRWSIWSWL